MIVRFTKAKNQSKPDTLTCVRYDGSRTWWPLPPHFTEHDLLHYVVETELGLKQAFFGMIAGGRNIEDFGTQQGQKDVYPPEAIQAEFLVGIPQAAMNDNDSASNDECMAALHLTAENNPELPPRKVTAEELDGIRAEMHQIFLQWRGLEAGAHMELPLPRVADDSRNHH